ncbi:PD-(D/E)XK nuclease family protein, partial [Parvimonas micra]|uniref:PD-(D/E)XK nuclease family protein n=1 Tax=Parvimonas micra TaxID=33033 RepID=UPI002B4AA58B
SDRIAFKQCRRKWAWSSHLKRNLGSRNLASPLWFGSAIHYALEDFHGYKHFETASDAFQAYCIATSKQHLRDLPHDAAELLVLGVKMMDYYTNTWLATRRADE